MVHLSKLRVCFVAGTLGQGGAERQLFYMLKVLHSSGCDVRLMAVTRGEFWEERIRQLGVPVISLPNHQPRICRFIRIIRELYKSKPEIIQSQHFYTNIYVVLAARLFGFHEVGAIRGDIGWKNYSKLTATLNLRIPRLIAANSRASIQKAKALAIPSSRLFFLPNVVETDVFRPGPRHVGGPIRILAAGTVKRLGREKRMDRFLRVLSILRTKTDFDFEAIIVGANAQRTELSQLAVELGLPPGVLHFKGGVLDMSAVYREADIFILTSDHEGMPNVILEAMASGLPVVATRVGGTAEIIEDGVTGFLFDRKDENGLAEGLLKLITHRQLRLAMGERGRKHIETNHSMKRLPGFLTALYEKALSMAV